MLRRAKWPGVWLIAALAVTGVGCESESTPNQASPDAGGTPDAVAELEPAAPKLARLTQSQYRAALADLFGPDVVLPAALEPDAAVKGLYAVGATINSVSPRGVELYFDGARSLARQVLESPTERAKIASCEPSGPTDSACLQTIIAEQGRRIWRRPLSPDEVAAYAGVGDEAAKALGDFWAGVEYALAGLLSSPNFVYRVELGEPDPDDPGKRRLTSYEMASRLSFFIWNSTPDQALLDAAEAGELTTDEGLKAQVERLLASDRAREGVRSFVAQWLDLHDLDEMSKDPNIFKHFSPDLAEAAREETLRFVEHHVFELDGDFRELFTSRTTFVNRRLAAIYNLEAPPGAIDSSEDGFGQIELPADGPRAGLLGQVSFLALHSHPVSSSATLRGLTIREKLLCNELPSPPSNLNTAIPEPNAEAKTLRDRLVQHMEDPSCAACHAQMDPVGFGLEQFDGIGRYRVEDNGAAIDPSGDLDAFEFASARELNLVLANHPNTPWCFVRTMYSYAAGHHPEVGEQALIGALTDRFEAGGHKVLALIGEIAMSEGFRTVGEVE